MTRTALRRHASRTAAAVLGFFVTAAVHAEGVVVGGASGSENSQGVYLGWVAPFPGQRLGQGWAYSAFADYLRYRYDASGTRIQASAPGFTLGIARQWTFAGAGAVDLGVIGSGRDTRLKPNDPGNGNDGFKFNPGLQLQWRADERLPVASGVFANYVFDRQAYYAKGFVGMRLPGGAAIGPESSIQGDRSYRITSTGLAVRDIAFGPLRLGLHAGVDFQSGRRTTPTGGLEFSYYIP